MKTAKEFFEKLGSDEAFAKEVNEALLRRREAGAQNVYETMIPVAAEYGYEVTEEELKAVNEQLSRQLTDEELGKVAGGTSCLTTLVLSATFAVESIVFSIASGF